MPSTIDITLAGTIGTVHPHVYGHFLEQNFFGNIEGGVFDEGSALADPETGFRTDVLAACRELGVPLVRWPGGNFTSAYHWTDGIGPRDARPRRLDLTWGGEESNRFGTDEFLAWCAAAGAEPFLVHSCRSVDDAVRWVEYTNHAGDTELTRQRAANGHPAPYPVRYWGVGNEVYGPWQMGYRSAEQYAADLREHARFMRAVDPELRIVAVGSHLEPEHWARQVLGRAGRLVDYLSIHLYAASTHLYTGDDYDAVVTQPAYFERQLTGYADLVHSLAGELGVDRPLSLAMDEWNIRHLEPEQWPEPERGAGGGFADRGLPDGAQGPRLRVNRYSPRTLADALFYAGVFHAMIRLSGHPVAPRMANTVNLTNANALLEVRPDGLVRSASYHVWDLYQNHTGPVVRPVTVATTSRVTAVRQGAVHDAERFRTRPETVADLDVVATTSTDGRRLELTVINRSRTTTHDAVILADGRTDGLPRVARVRQITAPDVHATNTLATPATVALRDRGEVKLDDSSYAFPPHSITQLAFTD